MLSKSSRLYLVPFSRMANGASEKKKRPFLKWIDPFV